MAVSVRCKSRRRARRTAEHGRKRVGSLDFSLPPPSACSKMKIRKIGHSVFLAMSSFTNRIVFRVLLAVGFQKLWGLKWI